MERRWIAPGRMVFAVFSLFGKLAGCGGDGYFSCISGEAMPPEKKKEGGEQHDDGEAGLQQHLEPGTGRPGYR